MDFPQTSRDLAPPAHSKAEGCFLNLDGQVTSHNIMIEQSFVASTTPFTVATFLTSER